MTGRMLFRLAPIFASALALALMLMAVVAVGADEKKTEYADGTDAEISFSAITLRIGAATLRAEVASSPAQRARGLSGREFMEADAGMLFIFSRPERPCFWMRNTLIPLDLAYLSAGGEILQTLSLIPHDESPRCAHRASLYGLEVNSGWLGRSGAGVGDVIPDLPGLAAGE